MKINKISQKILASVLMLAVLICGMFFLTACGEDEDKNAELNNRITELQNQLNNANKQNQEQQSQLENEVFMAKIKNSVPMLIGKLSTDLNLPTTPADRTISSLGLNYVANGYAFNDDDMLNTAHQINSYVTDMLSLFNTIIFNNSAIQFKTGEVYQDVQSSTQVCNALSVLDEQGKTLTLYIKRFNPSNNTVLDQYEMKINFNADFSNWVNFTCVFSIADVHGLVFIENGTSDYVIKSVSSVKINNEGIVTECINCDMDTNYYYQASYMAMTSFVSEYLLIQYGAQINELPTRVNNAFNGKIVYATLDFIPTAH